ncbi:uncharacterized protein LOC119673507 [Teleopsis dalmanni]|uniref:uncharacterized protein LOC119673507 n=1 Tax=Teleopsis dalmanni TaxID=139649 RepID=UPI0018CF13C7|nr:uncharacterized protein LOC119673507 [Teleopsis dalmanni]
MKAILLCLLLVFSSCSIGYGRAEYVRHEGSDIRPTVRNGVDCSISLSGRVKPFQPLFIIPQTDEFYPFNANGCVTLNSGDSIEFVCSDRFAAPLEGKNVIATCVRGSIFKVNGKDIDVYSISCTSWQYFTAKRTGKSCNGGILIEVGFQLDDKRFAKQYAVCFNESEEVTRYVHHMLSPGSNNFAIGVDCGRFTTANFFHREDVDRLYTRVQHQATINNLLGCSKYFDDRNDVILTRGHLAAKADFVYASQQRATYILINAAPQWHSFNGGNWEKIESSLRYWVFKQNKYIECWTGVWGVSSLLDINNQYQPLYLDYNSRNNGLIPVPKLFFRVVIEPSTGKGIVFVGVNNPYLSLDDILKDYVLCPDVSDVVTFINWNKRNIKQGYCYACEVAEFAKAVPNLPKFSVNGLLY